MLLGRPWLRTANIKQHWQRNMISFRRGKTKVRVMTEERVPVALHTAPLYAEGVHMLDGLADDEVEDFLGDHPTIVPLFEINAMSPTEQAPEAGVTEEVSPQDEPDPTTVAELRQARDAFERELAISQRVKASTLETINLGSDENPRTLQIANNMAPKALGIAKEFHDSIVDLVKRKRLLTEPEPEKPVEVRTTHRENMALEDELAESHYSRPHWPE